MSYTSLFVRIHDIVDGSSQSEIRDGASKADEKPIRGQNQRKRQRHHSPEQISQTHHRIRRKIRWVFLFRLIVAWQILRITEDGYDNGAVRQSNAKFLDINTFFFFS
uniref:Acetyltransferase NSI n=1 Tax=Rhizophora mucronata TaxID=61149 RepID=A0A2P2M381_RHIMU